MAVSRARLLRAAAHVVTWVPFLVGVGRSLLHGWVATSDNAIIALRSWDVLSTHAPMLGQATRLGTGVFDLGPLEYWLLTIPVHVDPVHGVLWGAALLCMLAASLTVEAAWSVGREYVALAASAAVLGVVLWNPEITALPCWNPWLGIMYFLLALAAALAVGAGRRGWWPVLVVAASIAAQAHLMFAIASVAIVLLAFAVGLYDTVRAHGGYRWLVIGLVAGVTCWSAPLLQQFTTKQGNMGALLSGKGSVGVKAGLGFGMKAIAAATQPPAYWWRPIRSLMKLSTVDSRAVAAGVAALVLVAAALLVSVFVLRRRWPAMLAALALLTSGGALVTYSDIRVYDIESTTSHTDNLRYLLTPMYPLGLLSWLAVGSVLVLLARRALGPAGSRAAPGGPAAAGPGSPLTAGPSAGVRVAGIAVAAVLVAASVSTSALYDGQHNGGSWVMRAVTGGSRQVEREIGSDRFALRVQAANKAYRRQLTMGIAYALVADGYRPLVSKGWGLQLGPAYRLHGQHLPAVLVTVLHVARPPGYALTVQVTKTPMPQW